MTQPKGKRPNTAAVCAELAAPVAEGIGVYLWDVVFEKEGAGWYLRYFIDKDADGGVTIDEDTRVLDKNGRPIRGLYAAGEITGGIHGTNRVGCNAVPDALIFGTIAGREVGK